MSSRYRLLLFLAALLFLGGWLIPAAAQEPELTIRLNRNWGYGGPNGDIEGTFSFHASGPDNLTAGGGDAGELRHQIAAYEEVLRLLSR